MPVDPRICCAAGVCCDPPHARAATVSILLSAGVDPKDVETVTDWLITNKITLIDASVTESIRTMIVTG